MKKIAFASVAMATLLTTASATWATLYTYTFSGQTLMGYSTTLGSGAMPINNSDLNNGARRFESESGEVLYSWKTSTQAALIDIVTNSGYVLAEFNLWGKGGTEAASWGETYTITTWTDTGVAPSGWISYPLDLSGTGNEEVLYFGSTGSTAALAFNESIWPTFSFTIDLPDTTTWLNGVVGQLVFWFGGTLVDPNTLDAGGNAVIAGDWQGNMILTGTAVPEPTTMLLLGAGLVGLAAAGRRNSKKAH